MEDHPHTHPIPIPIGIPISTSALSSIGIDLYYSALGGLARASAVGRYLQDRGLCASRQALGRTQEPTADEL